MAPLTLDPKPQPLQRALETPARRRSPPQMHQQASVYYTWERLGAVELDGVGELTLPVAPTRPAVFRFVAWGHARETLETGCVVNLARTFAALSTPSTVGRLARLRQRLSARLCQGDDVTVDAIFVGVIIPPNAPPRPADLSSPMDRQLVSLVARLATGDANRPAGL